MIIAAIIVTLILCVVIESVRIALIKIFSASSYSAFLLSGVVIWLGAVGSQFAGLIEVELIILILYLTFAASLEFALASLAWDFKKSFPKGSGLALTIAALAFFRFFMGYEASAKGLLAAWNPHIRSVALVVLLLSLGFIRGPLRPKRFVLRRIAKHDDAEQEK